MEMAGAQILMEGFLREGVERIFGYAGATICPIMDALMATPRISYTLVRTEQNAGHMASGYARVTGKTGVCIVTSGPGATNLITGIATAYMDSIPLVAVTGQVPSGLLGRDIFQEVDITGAVTPFIKHCYLVKDAARLPQIISEAFYIASSGRPGPVLIDIPIDIQEQMVQDPVFPDSVSIRGYNPSVRGNDKQIMRVAEAISQAERPVICAGGGVFLAGAEEELRELVSRTGIPSVTTMMGLSLFPTEHPLNMGMIGTHGNQCANKALAKADLLIMIGTRAADRAIFSPDEIQRRMPNIHIDVDPAEIGKNMSSTVPLVGDVKIILRQLLERDIAVECEPWRTQLQAFRREELSREFPSHPGYVFPMGYALPAAIGVQTAQPDRQVVVVCGDGSFQMAMNELATLRASRLSIKIVLIRNGVLGLVNQSQRKPPYHGSFGVALTGDPDFAAIAGAYGIPTIHVAEEAEVEGALERFLAEEGSCLLIAEADPEWNTGD